MSVRPTRSSLLALLLTAITPIVAWSRPLCPANAPELFPTVRPSVTKVTRATPAAEPAIHRDFWTWDLSVMPPSFRKATCTLRATGSRFLLYVEDTEWETFVTAEGVQTIFDRVEHATPASSMDPTKGIGELEFGVFGEPPLGLDGEPRVNLLYVRMDAFNGSSFDGYFNAFDTLTDQEAQQTYQQRSNEAEVLYLNTRGSPAASEYMIGVLAHELQHLLHHPHDGEEASWVNESLSESAMILTGHPTDIPHLERFAKRPETPLVTDGYVSYGACFLFGTYLLEQLGVDALRRITKHPGHGEEGIVAALAETSFGGDFAHFFEAWAIANLRASASPPEPVFSYKAFTMPPLEIRRAEALPAEFAGELKKHQIRYIGLPDRCSIVAEVTIEPESPAHLMLVKVDKQGNTQIDTVLEGSGQVGICNLGGRRVLMLRGVENGGFRILLRPKTDTDLASEHGAEHGAD